MSDKETPTGNPVTALQAFIEGKTKDLQKWAVGATDATDLVKFALFDCAESTALQKCSHKSIYFSLIAAAKIGLPPDGVHGAIIPYGTVATFQPMYQGLVRLAIESGHVLDIFSAAVFANDTFKVELGTAQRIQHEPADGSRGEVVGAYAVAMLASGGQRFEVITKEQLASIKAKGAANSPAWREFPDEMARKSAVKRLCKTLPKTPQMVMAEKVDNMATIGDQAGYRKIIDVPTD